MMVHAFFLPGMLAFTMLAASSAGAQSRSVPPEQVNDTLADDLPVVPRQPPVPSTRLQVGAAELGQRQSRDQAVGFTGTGRLSNRIQSRVPSRLRNRIDRDFDPGANALSPYSIAQEQVRSGTGARR